MYTTSLPCSNCLCLELLARLKDNGKQKQTNGRYLLLSHKLFVFAPPPSYTCFPDKLFFFLLSDQNMVNKTFCFVLNSLEFHCF